MKENSCKTVLSTSAVGWKVVVGGTRLPQLPHPLLLGVHHRSQAGRMIIFKCQRVRERERERGTESSSNQMAQKRKEHKEGKKCWVLYLTSIQPPSLSPQSLVTAAVVVVVVQFISTLPLHFTSNVKVKCITGPGLDKGRARGDVRGVLLIGGSHSCLFSGHLTGFLTTKQPHN